MAYKIEERGGRWEKKVCGPKTCTNGKVQVVRATCRKVRGMRISSGCSAGSSLAPTVDGKIKAEWVGRINGLVFTIYDYKSLVEPERNTDWHIGGNHKIVVCLVIAYFNLVLK